MNRITIPIQYKCYCNMYLSKGTCWHTGYTPEWYVSFYDRIKKIADKTIQKGEEDNANGSECRDR